MFLDMIGVFYFSIYTTMHGIETMSMANSWTGMGALSCVIWCLVVLLMIVSFWRIFAKAKLPGWGILVPIYNVYLLFKVIGKPRWTRWLLFLPVFVILRIIANFKLAKCFGKSDGFGVGLWLLPFIFYPILAFSKDIKYISTEK